MPKITLTKRGGGSQRGGYQQAQQIQESEQWGWSWPGASAIAIARKQRGGSRVASRGGAAAGAGWHDRAPKRGTPRHTLMNKCGSKCFLMPDTEGFPICASSYTCEFDCDGILAAYRRAKQYKYPQVAETARLLATKQGCPWIH